MPRLDEARLSEWKNGAEQTLADDLPAAHKLWKPWALDLADQVLALVAALRVERETNKSLHATWKATEKELAEERERAERLEQELGEAAKWIALQDAPDAGIVVAEIEARLRALSGDGATSTHAAHQGQRQTWVRLARQLRRKV